MVCGFHCYYDPVYGWHEGTDYELGTPGAGGEVVAAAAGGTAKPCPLHPSAGNYIVIDHGNGHRTRYLHLNGAPLPTDGQAIARGAIIGYEGNTGYTDPPGFYHLHFETRVDATTFTCGKDGTAVDPYAGPYSPGTYMWEDNPPNHADFSPAVASWASSRVDVFVRGKNDDLYQRTLTGGSWSGWSRPRPGDCLRSAPSASTWGTSRIDVFYRGCDNDLWRTTWNGSSWSMSSQPRPGQCLLSAPAATSWGTNRIDVFFRGCDNDLWRITWNGSSWSTPIRPIPGQCMRSSPAAVARGVNQIDVFYRGCDNGVWRHWYDNGPWQTQGLGGCTMTAPAVASWAANRLDVFVRGCEDGPYHMEGIFQTSWNGTSWSGFVNRGGCLASGPGSDAWSPDWLNVVYRGCDSPAGLYEAYWNGSAWAHFDFGVDWP
jgi:hypothetical protein